MFIVFVICLLFFQFFSRINHLWLIDLLSITLLQITVIFFYFFLFILSRILFFINLRGKSWVRFFKNSKIWFILHFITIFLKGMIYCQNMNFKLIGVEYISFLITSFIDEANNLFALFIFKVWSYILFKNFRLLIKDYKVKFSKVKKF